MYVREVLIFVIFLCPLIFFHELGHYLFARLFGVRVEVFSLGFGPKLLKFKRGDTEYAFSIIPLGGYVKMYGDDLLNKEGVPLEEQKNSYSHKGKWARFWIVFGGPLANFVLAFLIFWGLSVLGEKVPEPLVGSISKESKLYQIGLRPGDRFQKINEKKILSIADIPVTSETELINEVEVVSTDGDVRTVLINLTVKDFMEEYFSTPPRLRAPFLIDIKNNVWGLSLDNSKFNKNSSLEYFENNWGSKFTNVYLHPFGNINEFKLESSKVVPGEIREESYTAGTGFLELLRNKGIYPIDLNIQTVMDKTPALKAGIRGNDILVDLNNQTIYSFEDLKTFLLKVNEKNEVSVGLLRQGERVELKLVPEVKVEDGKTYKFLGIKSSGTFQDANFVESRKENIFTGFVSAFPKTLDAIVMTAVGFKKLITNEVSIKSIGGPIAIGKVASDSFDISLSYFLKLMALISVNLGVINLFPIPVLDGGHLFFIGLEAISRKPLTRKWMEIAQQVGISLLFVLIFFALYNDLTRFLI